MDNEQVLDIYNLSGHSGCLVQLCNYNTPSSTFVRKISSNKQYNTRLKKQYIKQRVFQLEGIDVPKILNKGYIDNKFYFDMQYINCQTFADNVEILSIQNMDKMLNMLISVLPSNSRIEPDKANIAFTNKIHSLFSYTNNNEIYKRSFDKLINFNFSNIPISYCCGDLTLENILLSNEGNIYLIDFLDSFYNSWMIDIAKLLQDIDLYWSYRNKELSTNIKIRLLLLKQKLIKRILQMPDGEYLCLEIYYILLLNLMRIIQYVKDYQTYDWLQNALLKTMETIKVMEE